MKTVSGSTKEAFPVSFRDTALAFKDKTDRELFLAYLIFWLTKSPFLVKFLSQAAKFTMAIGLPVKPIIKATVFKQFCGGETKEEYSRLIARLSGSKIATILDYSVEGEDDEKGFDSTMNEVLKTIDQARLKADIPCACLKMTGIGRLGLFEKVTAGEALNDGETKEWNTVQNRLLRICRAAENAGKPIYIDAEESWIQGAIDGLAEKMMVAFNSKKAVVFTTIQLYRKDRLDYFRQLIKRARAGSFKIGMKIVRGAYLERERERAQDMGYPSPINPDKASTDASYNQALEVFMENIDVVELCVGTHNEYSCQLLTQYMARQNLPNNHPHVWFAQLFGMSDTISYALAQSGYNVSKYLPFGPVASTLPYLARRAEENTAIAGQMSKELEIITKERKRRKQMKKKTRKGASYE